MIRTLVVAAGIAVTGITATPPIPTVPMTWHAAHTAAHVATHPRTCHTAYYTIRHVAAGRSTRTHTGTPAHTVSTFHPSTCH